MLLWTAIGLVGLLLAAILLMSIGIARKTNEHLVNHRAFAVAMGLRTVLRTRRGMRDMGPWVLQDAIKLLNGPGILHLGVLGRDLHYIASSNPDEIGDLTPFKTALRAFAQRKRLSESVKWNGQSAEVFVFPGPGHRPRFMHRDMGMRPLMRPFAMEVVVTKTWPAWLKTWIIFMMLASIFTMFLLSLFAFLIKKQTVRADHLLLQTQKNRELQRLGELSALVAHQLRNPLAGIKGNLQLGMERSRSQRHEAAMQDFEVALDQVEGIETLVRDLLAFTRRLEVRRRQVDMADLVDTLAGEYVNAGKDVKVRVLNNGNIPLDPTLIRQAIVNLLNNAMESIEKDAKVLITIDCGSDKCVLNVADNGPGLDMGMQDKVFDPFVSTKARGTGLGLALVAKVVQAHGGTVKAGHSEEMGGAMFTIILPKAEAKND